MAVGLVDRQKLVNIADAVREKKGITGEITLDGLASNIASIPTADNNAKYDFTGSGSKSRGDVTSYLTSIDLTGFDTSNYTNMGGMFQSFESIKSIDVSGLDTSKVTDMQAMFQNCFSLESLDLSNYDFSKVQKLTYFVGNCYALKNINFGNNNFSSATDMSNMFYYCHSLTSLDLSNWNTSKVGTSSYTSFTGMFKGCSSLESLDISSFDLSNTYGGSNYSLNTMFYFCSSLKTLKLPNSVSFNKTNIYLDDMFNNCSSLESLDLTGWNTTNVTSMSCMFMYCHSLKNLTLGENWASNSSITSFDLAYCPLTRESAVDVLNKLATRDNSPVIRFSNKVGLYQSEIDIATNKGWSVSGCSVFVEDPSTATVGQFAIIDGEVAKCVYVADEPQDWGQRIFGSSIFIDSNYNSEFQWGGKGISTGVTDTAIGTGLSNTNALLAMNLKSTNGTPTIWDALKEFRASHSDRWFIPSRNEGKDPDNSTKKWTSSEYTGTWAYLNNQNSEMSYWEKSASYPFSPFTYV